MPTLTREQALCILHHAPFNEKNAKKYVEMLDNSEGLEVCYMEDPLEPIIMSNFRINRHPFRFQRYSNENLSSPISEARKLNSAKKVDTVKQVEAEKQVESAKKASIFKQVETVNQANATDEFAKPKQLNTLKTVSVAKQATAATLVKKEKPADNRIIIKRQTLTRTKKHIYRIASTNGEKAVLKKVDESMRLVTCAQAIELLNSVYLPNCPEDPESYVVKQVRLDDILQFLKKYSNVFDNTKHNYLGTWLNLANAALMKTPKCKGMEINHAFVQNTYTFRELFVLEESFHMELLQDILSHTSNHVEHIKALKANDYCIVGYTRKSASKISHLFALRILKRICKALKSVSLVDHAFYKCYCSKVHRGLESIATEEENSKVWFDGEAKGK
ncbi:hypothetical protein BY458DRAFT_497415 [Sporodiniella umbellata]|nr:hypothetical protein BY458DRAFT_497415 [Sporodiniella umbellata]